MYTGSEFTIVIPEDVQVKLPLEILIKLFPMLSYIYFHQTTSLKLFSKLKHRLDVLPAIDVLFIKYSLNIHQLFNQILY